MLPQHAGSKVPAIVMSALDAERDFGRGFAAGATDYMGKPFGAGELLARVQRHLDRVAPSRDEGPALAFGRYWIERELGRGAYGRVFLARDAGRGGARVALKVLAAPEGEQADARLRFIRETLALARLDHPSIVRVLDVTESQGQIGYAMEYVEGETLEQHVLAHGPLDEGEARALAQGLLRALAALEAAGIVHRDLKPSNVVLSGNDPSRPVLIDFGLSRNERDHGLTEVGVSLGTPAYMAPEVIVGDAADHRSDLFSLGLVIRYALTGKQTFEAENLRQLLSRMIAGPVPPLELSITEPFALLLSWLVERDRSSRSPSALAALRAVEALSKAQLVAA
jgi:serine/threonine protein kinase